MVGVAVVCVDDDHAFRIIEKNLGIQGWIPRRTIGAFAAIEAVRKEEANLLIVANRAIDPMTQEELLIQLARDPGEGKVKVINLDIKSPQPPTIFINPKGPLPPAVAVRPVEWIVRNLNLK
jgi:hypothetical protein